MVRSYACNLMFRNRPNPIADSENYNWFFSKDGKKCDSSNFDFTNPSLMGIYNKGFTTMKVSKSGYCIQNEELNVSKNKKYTISLRYRIDQDWIPTMVQKEIDVGGIEWNEGKLMLYDHRANSSGMCMSFTMKNKRIEAPIDYESFDYNQPIHLLFSVDNRGIKGTINGILSFNEYIEKPTFIFKNLKIGNFLNDEVGAIVEYDEFCLVDDYIYTTDFVVPIKPFHSLYPELITVEESKKTILIETQGLIKTNSSNQDKLSQLDIVRHVDFEPPLSYITDQKRKYEYQYEGFEDQVASSHNYKGGINMAYNREDMITWNELAPSLQTIITNLNNGIEELNAKYREEHNAMGDLGEILASLIRSQNTAQEQMQASIDQLLTIQNNIKEALNENNSNQSAIGEQLSSDITTLKTTLSDKLGTVEAAASGIKTSTDTLKDTCSRIESSINTIKSACNNLGSINTTAALMKTACDDIKDTTDSINTIQNSVLKAITDNHTEIKELLEDIKENGGTGGGGTTPAQENAFNLSDVTGGVTEFTSLSEEEQQIANELKLHGSTNEEIIAWLRLARAAEEIDLDATFDVYRSTAEGARELGDLTDAEQAAADALKKIGKSDEEIVAWIQENRTVETPEEPDPVFDITTVDGAKDLDPLTEEEQEYANYLKSKGKSDAEIVAWIRDHRPTEQLVFDINSVEGAEDLIPLSTAEQAYANQLKNEGKSDEYIIAAIRDGRPKQFKLSDVEGAEERFGSLSAAEQAYANQLKSNGSSNAAIIAWLVTQRFLINEIDESINIDDFIETPLTAEEQETANSLKRTGHTDEEIIATLRANRVERENIELFEGVIDEETDLRVHSNTLTAHNDLKSNKLMMHHTNTAYEAGDTVYIAELPSYMALTAVVGGVTAATRTDFGTVFGTVLSYEEPDEDAIKEEVIEYIQNKIQNNSTTVNVEISDLHRRAFNHIHDQTYPHDLTTTSRYMHKKNHNYTTKGERVFANKLEPYMMLEVNSIGTTGSTLSAEMLKCITPDPTTYVVPEVTNANRETILNGIISDLDVHKTDPNAHYYNDAEYLFRTSESIYQYVKPSTLSNNYRLAVEAY